MLCEHLSMLAGAEIRINYIQIHKRGFKSVRTQFKRRIQGNFRFAASIIAAKNNNSVFHFALSFYCRYNRGATRSNYNRAPHTLQDARRKTPRFINSGAFKAKKCSLKKISVRLLFFYYNTILLLLRAQTKIFLIYF